MDLDVANLKPVAAPVLIIAMTARTGSTQLCSILSQLGNFGNPVEIFNTRSAVRHLRRRYCRGCEDDYLVNMAHGLEVFCFKVAGCDWQPVSRHASRLFPNARYVYLQRRDLDAQSLSLARAIVSGRWHRTVDDPVDGQGQCSPPAELRERCRRTIEGERAGWLRFFNEHGIAPLPLWYEDNMADPASMVRKVCQFADVDICGRTIPQGSYLKLSP
jgi:LPS sulfotransferase NodH